MVFQQAISVNTSPIIAYVPADNSNVSAIEPRLVSRVAVTAATGLNGDALRSNAEASEHTQAFGIMPTSISSSLRSSDPPLPIRRNSLSACVRAKPILRVMPSSSRQRVVSTRTAALYRHDSIRTQPAADHDLRATADSCAVVIAIDETA